MRVVIKDTEPEGDRLFVFETEEEREIYFRETNKQVLESQRKSLADANRVYMSNIVIARKPRAKVGKQRTKDLLQEVNRGYAEQVQKIHTAYARALANIRKAQETSILESEMETQGATE